MSLTKRDLYVEMAVPPDSGEMCGQCDADEQARSKAQADTASDNGALYSPRFRCAVVRLANTNTSSDLNQSPANQ